MKIIKFISFIALSFLAMPLHAQLYAQRNCQPDDLQIDSGYAVETQCEWQKNDDLSLQVTLHSKNVYLINGTCIFTPGENSKDKVIAIVGHKAAKVKNISIKGNSINFEVLNIRTDANMNVLFYLNDIKFSAGNKLHCTFYEA